MVETLRTICIWPTCSSLLPALLGFDLVSSKISFPHLH